MTNLGKWHDWYCDVTEPTPYANTLTYELGAQWLADCTLIEDWGCGMGWLRTIVPSQRYVGLDGTDSLFVDQVVDLAAYRSRVPGVFMRHVLEHNRDWGAVLDNALASFTHRMALIVFTPMQAHTHDLSCDLPGVPTIGFAAAELTARMDAAGVGWTVEEFQTEAFFGVETLYRIAACPLQS